MSWPVYPSKIRLFIEIQRAPSSQPLCVGNNMGRGRRGQEGDQASDLVGRRGSPRRSCPRQPTARPGAGWSGRRVNLAVDLWTASALAVLRFKMSLFGAWTGGSAASKVRMMRAIGTIAAFAGEGPDALSAGFVPGAVRLASRRRRQPAPAAHVPRIFPPAHGAASTRGLESHQAASRGRGSSRPHHRSRDKARRANGVFSDGRSRRGMRSR